MVTSNSLAASANLDRTRCYETSFGNTPYPMKRANIFFPGDRIGTTAKVIAKMKQNPIRIDEYGRFGELWVYFSLTRTRVPQRKIPKQLTGRFVIAPDSTSLIFSILWTLATTGVGLACGFIMGRIYAMNNEAKHLKTEKESTLKALLALLQSTHQLNEDVDTHNRELITAQKSLEETASQSNQYESLQTTVLEQITSVVKANRKLENDLVRTQYQLETQAQEIDRTRKEARTDALCSIGNRKAFDEAMSYMMSCYTVNEASFALLLVDVDHFKRINDSFGHNAGDQVLVSIGSALKQCVRPEDFVSRLGGDEFAIMLQGICEETAPAVAERIRSTIELFDFSVGSEGQSTVATLSMGLTVVCPADSGETLYKRADRALYRSKELGRNRIFTLLPKDAPAFMSEEESTNPERTSQAPASIVSLQSNSHNVFPQTEIT